jgi:hypothetical protein
MTVTKQRRHEITETRNVHGEHDIHTTVAYKPGKQKCMKMFRQQLIRSDTILDLHVQKGENAEMNHMSTGVETGSAFK